MEHYFKQQAELAGKDCNFQCPEGCNAPGCCMEGLIIGVTLFDLIRLSPALNKPVSEIFHDHCQLGLQSYVLNPRYKHLLVKLKSPCHFLRESHCTVHSSKPLNCVLFPEYHQMKGLIDDLLRQPLFRKFPCLNGRIVISDPRKKALRVLRRMSQREEALSYDLLFGAPAFIIDPKPLNRWLKRELPGKRLYSNEDYDRLFLEQFKLTGLLNHTRAQVFELDTSKGRERIFAKLKDSALIALLLEKLLQPELVHRFNKNHFQRIKRKVQPLVYADI